MAFLFNNANVGYAVMSSVNQPVASNLITRWLDTPLGPLEIGVKDQACYWYFDFKQPQDLTDVHNTDKHPLLDLAESHFKEYFAGTRKTFSELLAYVSDYGTDFQQACWQSLIHIPYGETWTYGQQAKFMDKPKASRAVGAANGKNPLTIVVPCHRVIGTNGTLTGYAGGLDKKKWLLEFENPQNNLAL